MPTHRAGNRGYAAWSGFGSGAVGRTGSTAADTLAITASARSAPAGGAELRLQDRRDRVAKSRSARASTTVVR
jgi:hypothetical protein